MRAGLLTCAYVVSGVVAACGGADSTLGDGGPNDTGTNDVVNPPNDSGSDVAMQAMCDGGQVSCGGQCVDTQTSAQNCGGCGIMCNTTCTAGVCQLIGSTCDAGATTVGDNACLTIDSANVYWGTGFNAGGTVWKIPLGGGCPIQMIGGQAAPHGMASDGTTLFFADQGATAGSGSIQSIPVSGTTATLIAMSQSTPLDVALDATNVYWTNSGDGSVWMSNKTTPNPTKLAGPNGAGHAGYLAVDATYVYFSDPSAGVINRVPIATGSTTALTTMVSAPGHVTIDSTTLYFGSRGMTTTAILSVALNAMAATPAQVVTSLPAVNGIYTDGTSLWWAENTDVQPYMTGTGEIHRATIAGTSDTKLATKQNGPNCISVDSTSIYWIDTGGGMISKTGK